MADPIAQIVAHEAVCDGATWCIDRIGDRILTQGAAS